MAALSTLLRAGGTVLYDSRAVALARIDTDASGALWVRKSDLPRINGFELKPQGACRADICIPIPRAMMRGDLFNLTAFAQPRRPEVHRRCIGPRVELR